MSRWGAIVTGSDKNGTQSFATGSTTSEAAVKGLAEGFERYALQQYRRDRFESADKLGEPFLDPRIVVPFTAAQTKELKGIVPFDPQKKIEWLVGTRKYDGSLLWVPSSLVFYPKGPSFYHANSSGVAAHFDRKLAIDAALRELIERDAISLTWYCKRPVRAIAHGQFPDDLQERIQAWEQVGYKVTLLDLTVDGLPVVLAMISSPRKRLALFSGAACNTDIVDAANRAFNEAEFMGMTWFKARPSRKLVMERIHDTSDHARFHMDPKNLAHARWLIDAKEKEASSKRISDVPHYDPIVVDITPKEHSCGLVVVRVLSEHLMPINFGYGSEHSGHRRIRVLGLRWNQGCPATPHFFA